MPHETDLLCFHLSQSRLVAIITRTVQHRLCLSGWQNVLRLVGRIQNHNIQRLRLASLYLTFYKLSDLNCGRPLTVDLCPLSSLMLFFFDIQCMTNAFAFIPTCLALLCFCFCLSSRSKISIYGTLLFTVAPFLKMFINL